MEEILRGAILGLIQGLTEFFPVSSSGHLILVPRLFGWDDQGIAFDTVLHLGTLAALFWIFRKDIHDLYIGSIQKNDAASKRLVAMIIVAAIPGVVVGGLFGGFIEAAMRSPHLVALNLAGWGIVLFIADFVSRKRKRSIVNTKDIKWWQALVIGCSQALALSPGTSRSGITATSGLFSGLDRSTAVTFSFLVSIPTIAAAGAYGSWKLIQEGVTVSNGLQLLAGFIVAACAGAWAIRFLRSYVASHTFTPFVIYRIALAIIIFVVLAN